MKSELMQSRRRAPPIAASPTAPLSRAELDYYNRRAHYLRSAAFSRAIENASGALARGFGALFRALKESRDRRRAVAELRHLDDRMLKDVGIERSQIPFIVEQLLERRKADGNARKSYPLRVLTAPPQRRAAADDERCPPLAA